MLCNFQTATRTASNLALRRMATTSTATKAWISLTNPMGACSSVTAQLTPNQAFMQSNSCVQLAVLHKTGAIVSSRQATAVLPTCDTPHPLMKGGSRAGLESLGRRAQPDM